MFLSYSEGVSSVQVIVRNSEGRKEKIYTIYVVLKFVFQGIYNNLQIVVNRNYFQLFVDTKMDLWLQVTTHTSFLSL